MKFQYSRKAGSKHSLRALASLFIAAQVGIQSQQHKSAASLPNARVPLALLHAEDVDSTERFALIARAESLAEQTKVELGGKGVEGAEKLTRAILRVARTAKNARNCFTLEGAKNNLEGLAAELHVAKTAPDVVAVRKRFQESGDARSIEVDVVAHGGALWIEVKYNSGNSLSYDSLKCQVSDMMASAALPSHYVNHKAPAVCVWLMGGEYKDVDLQELSAAGAVIAREAEDLPSASRNVSHAVLDVVALCALCGEVTNGGAGSPDVNCWAQQDQRRRRCVTDELREPIQLHLRLRGFTLHALQRDILDFENRLKIYGGVQECVRWFGEHGWKKKITAHQSRDPLGHNARVALAESLQGMVVTSNARAAKKTRANDNVSAEFLLIPLCWLAGV